MNYSTGVSKITDNLFLGGASAIFEVDALREAGITNVLKLYFDEPEWPEDFQVCDNPLDDGVFIDQETLRRGVTFVNERVAAGEKVLVVCGVGISRSTTFVLAHLLEQGYNLQDAFQLVRAARSQVWPMQALWQSLITHYGAAYTLEQIEGWREATS